jgi:hypothetical protein
MIRLFVMLLLMTTVTSVSAGECSTGRCSNVRSRVVNVTREIVSVPVTVTRRTVETARNIGRKTVSRFRSIVR